MAIPDFHKAEVQTSQTARVEEGKMTHFVVNSSELSSCAQPDSPFGALGLLRAGLERRLPQCGHWWKRSNT